MAAAFCRCRHGAVCDACVSRVGQSLALRHGEQVGAPSSRYSLLNPSVRGMIPITKPRVVRDSLRPARNSTVVAITVGARRGDVRQWRWRRRLCLGRTCCYQDKQRSVSGCFGVEIDHALTYLSVKDVLIVITDETSHSSAAPARQRRRARTGESKCAMKRG